MVFPHLAIKIIALFEFTATQFINILKYVKSVVNKGDKSHF